MTLSRTEALQLLNLNESSTLEDIKSSYKNLAKVSHPDKGGDSDQFLKIKEAYELLSDKNKEEITSPIFQHEIIEPCIVKLKLFIHDVCKNSQIKTKIQRKKVCSDCLNDVKKCEFCNGFGFQQINMNMFMNVHLPCINCQGSGLVPSKYCRICKNQRLLHEEIIVNIHIPQGTKNNDILTIENQGNSSKYSEKRGDLKIHIHIEEDKLFQRVDQNLYMKKNITLLQALFGLEFTLIHPSHEKIHVDIKKCIQPFSSHTLKHKGVTPDGDLVKQFIVELPIITDQHHQDKLREIFYYYDD
jgi:DnaJ-class molecular chaperone